MESPPTAAHVAARVCRVAPPAFTPANDNEPPDPPPALALRALAPRFLVALPEAGAGGLRQAV